VLRFSFACSPGRTRTGMTLDGKFKPVPEPVDNYSPTQGFFEEFITYDEFFGTRFNLLGCGQAPNSSRATPHALQHLVLLRRSGTQQQPSHCKQVPC
jgi:hypothetical protein